MIRVFIGYDSHEVAAYHVLAQSILHHASEPVTIAPVKRSLLEKGRHYMRPRGASESTEFSMSRFIVPHLCGYSGFALFIDCDMMFRDDIAKLWALRDGSKSVMVVKHDYAPKSAMKMRGAMQLVYPKKNWSSVMLFSCGLCGTLTPDYVNEASGLELHQFKWTQDELIGELPATWNHLVGEYDYDPDAKLVHWTLGGPWWSEFSDVEYADEWFGHRTIIDQQ